MTFADTRARHRNKVAGVARAYPQDTAWQAIFAVVLGLLVVVASVCLAAAQPKKDGHDNVTLEGTYSDVQFLAGRSVHVKAQVSDDVFAAGRDVTFDAATVENAITAGYDIELRGGSVADMIAVGANVNVGGVVQDDVMALARSLRISENGDVHGDVRAAGETIDMAGRIGGSFRAAGRRITITGHISGKADLLAQRIVIGPTAVITGDLVYRSDQKPEIADGATIGGQVRHIESKAPGMRRFGLAILGIGIAIALAWALAVLVLVALIQAAFPGFMTDATEKLRVSPWANLGRGVVVWLVTGAVIGLLLVSVVGIPLGLPLMMALAVLTVFALATVSLCIGLTVRRWRRGDEAIGTGGRIGWALFGVVILGIAGLIPWIGGIVVTLAVAAGLGATTAELWPRLRAA